MANPKLEVDRNVHYLKNALTLARLAQLAYTDAPGSIRDKLKPTFSRVTHLRKGGAQGFVCANDDNIVVAFRGTDEPIDWISDVQYRQVRGYGGHVHRGFADQMAGIEERMLAAVKKYRDAKQAVWVTGHSLGGALATLAAKMLGRRYRKEPFMTNTFGSPRVLNPTAAEALKQTIYRFVNDQDIVPHVPSRGLINRYEHVGTRVHFTKAGDISTDKQSWLKAAEALAKIAATGVGSVAKSAINDHKMSQYIRKIRHNLA